MISYCSFNHPEIWSHEVSCPVCKLLKEVAEQKAKIEVLHCDLSVAEEALWSYRNIEPQ